MKKIVYSVFDITNMLEDTELNLIFTSSDLFENYSQAKNYLGLTKLSIPTFEDVHNFFALKMSASLVLNGNGKICKICKMIIE